MRTRYLFHSKERTSAATHNLRMSVRIGVDLGGTKIEIVALASSKMLMRWRIPTPAGDYDATLDAIANLVRETERALSATATVGIGTPGAIAPDTGLIKNANSTVLIGRPLKLDLQRALGREIRMANDADCFTLSEAIDGAACDASVVFGVILGTGVGGGIAVDKRIVQGPNAIAGEWGHNPLPRPAPQELPGPPCYCGKRGCIETFLSGPALTRQYAELGGQGVAAEDIVSRAREGDAFAQRAMSDYEERLARSLATVVNVLDPDAIVLGGGLSNAERLYAALPPLLERYVFSDRLRTRILRACHGDSSGVRGAAMLWP